MGVVGPLDRAPRSQTETRSAGTVRRTQSKEGSDVERTSGHSAWTGTPDVCLPGTETWTATWSVLRNEAIGRHSST